MRDGALSTDAFNTLIQLLSSKRAAELSHAAKRVKKRFRLQRANRVWGNSKAASLWRHRRQRGRGEHQAPLPPAAPVAARRPSGVQWPGLIPTPRCVQLAALLHYSSNHCCLGRYTHAQHVSWLGRCHVHCPAPLREPTRLPSAGACTERRAHCCEAPRQAQTFYSKAGVRRLPCLHLQVSRWMERYDIGALVDAAGGLAVVPDFLPPFVAEAALRLMERLPPGR